MIRRATLSDIPSLIELNGYVHGLHVSLFPDVFKANKPALVGQLFANLVTKDDHCILVADEDNLVQGYIFMKKLVKPEYLFKYETRCGYIDQVSIHPDHRRKGIFKALLHEASRIAASWGMDRLELDVWSQNSVAVDTYEKSGFKTCNQKMTLFLEK